MPDSPAHNDFLRKISLDPGTERLATKKELVALLEKDETPKTSQRISASAEKIEPAKSSAANSTAEKASDVVRKNVATALAEIETETPARPMPIPNTFDDVKTFHVDLVELASILDQHKIWVESGGDEGTKADLSGVNLENADLTGVNLQGAILQRANLRNADLSMANLKGTTLARADLTGANLLGAELRGANLMGAQLYGAEGLWLGRLGGANLYDAMLPETISSIDGSKAVWEATKTARWFYFLMLAASLVGFLVVATTSDARLILDGPTIPIRRLGNFLPINGFYLIAPIALLVIFVRFQFLLLRVWSSMAALPAVFQDGQTVEREGPWYLMGLVRRHFRWLRDAKTAVSMLENVIATILAYWVVPIVIALIWMRYLVRQDLRGTALHVLFFVLSVSVATGLPAVVSRVIRPGEIRRPSSRSVLRLAFMTLRIPIAAGLVLLTLSLGVIWGVPAETEASKRYFSASPRRWAAEAFRFVGYRPYADLIESSLVVPVGKGEEDGAKLNEGSLRYARAYRASLPDARLWRGDLIGAYLTETDLQGANLREAKMRDSVFDHANLEKAVLISADGTSSNLTGANLKGADLTYAVFTQANFANAKLGGASLYGANLQQTKWLRADLTRADVRDTQLQGALLSLSNLELADFSGAKLGGATLSGAQMKGTIFLGSDLREADLRGAVFTGTVVRDSLLDGAKLDGADLHGVLGMTGTQLCSTASWRDAQMDPDLLADVQAKCGSRASVAVKP
ncbi:MAG TPA: pentapeptide repeat-containing protein [Candidatus Acidoferrum sp.]|nr:pentapeptide repeat-containing protein [Candidatus Acidoferrum sp.]